MRIDIGDGTRLFFDVMGSALRADLDELRAKPTLLLLHGGPGFDHSSFRPYFDRFADTHQVIYLDHRGNGRSDGWDDSKHWNLDTWADDVVRFCDALEIVKPTVLGVSFGGFVAIRYAARHPDHPAKIVLSSTATRRFPELSASRFADLGGPEAAASYRRVFVDDDTSMEAMIDYATINLPLYGHVPSGFGPTRTMMNLAIIEGFNEGWFAMDLRPDLPKITAPTLVLGGRDDPMTPHECSTEIAELLSPGVGQLEIFESCGHGSFRDQPDATETTLRAFFATDEEASAG